jgi:hypothetical protein
MMPGTRWHGDGHHHNGAGGQSVEAEAGHKRQRGHHHNGRQVGNGGGASAKGNATNGTDGSRRTAAKVKKEEVEGD